MSLIGVGTETKVWKLNSDKFLPKIKIKNIEIQLKKYIKTYWIRKKIGPVWIYQVGSGSVFFIDNSNNREGKQILHL